MCVGIGGCLACIWGAAQYVCGDWGLPSMYMRSCSVCVWGLGAA